MTDTRTTTYVSHDENRKPTDDVKAGAITCSHLISSASLREPDYLVASEWHEHSPFLFWLMATLRPRSFVELGTYTGYSYFTACQAVAEFGLGTSCYAVSAWREGAHASFGGDEAHTRVLSHNSSKYDGFSQILRAEFDDAATYFADRSIGVLHIRSRHHYVSLMHDLEVWRQKLAPDAIILFHFTDVRRHGVDVWRLIGELKKDRPIFEFKHGHGLTIVAWGEVPPALADLFAANDETADFLRAVYAKLGNSITRRWNRIAVRDCEIEGLTNKVAISEQEKSSLQHNIAAKDAEFLRRESEFVRRLRDSIEKKDLELAKMRTHLEARIYGYQRMIDRFRSESTDARSQLRAVLSSERSRRREIEAQLQRATALSHGILNSVSWRITTPARRLSTRYPRATRAAIHIAGLTAFVATLQFSRLASAVRSRRRLRREAQVVIQSGLFDAGFYVRTYRDIAHDPLRHYLMYGWHEGRRPHPLFDGEWYRSQNPDLAESISNPLVHFIEIGMREYRNPNPFFDMRRYVTLNPDVASSGLDPVTHYMRIGAPRLADPSSAFSTAWYVDRNSDVVRLGVNPLEHFLTTGREEGRLPRLPDPDFATARPVTSARIDCRKSPVVRTETALFVSHSPDGVLKPHVRGYVNALAREGIGVILIVAADQGFVDDTPDLYDVVDGLFVRDNEGFDFAAWAHVLRLHRELYRSATLYLLNDSIIGPLNDVMFHAVIERLRRTDVDLVGMTENYQRGGWHIQSYFLALKQRVLQSHAWHQFILGIASLPTKDDVIHNYEVKLAPALVAAGLTATALFKVDFRDNPPIFRWRQLIRDGFPFIKVQLIRDAIDDADATGWRETLEGIGFTTSIVDDLLAGATTASQAANQPARSESATIPAASHQPLRIAFIGPWNYDNGAGGASRGYISALMQTGYSIHALPIVNPIHTHHRISPAVEFSDFVGPPDLAVVHINPEGWWAEGLVPPSQQDIIRNAAFRIGVFVWESQQLPATFGARMRQIDAVWAPSEYCARIFRSATDTPVDVINECINLRPPRSNEAEIKAIKEWLGLGRENKIVLYSFDSSSNLGRKNPMALISAFRDSDLFSAGWRLVLKTKLTSDEALRFSALQNAVNACPGVSVIDRRLGEDALAAVMDAMDIYASPHRSEGFGRTIAEAMSIGKIVVATDYGGSRDFLDHDTGFPVRCTEVQIGRSDGWYPEGTIWAEIDAMHLSKCLVAAATLSSEKRQQMADRARQRILTLLSPETAAARMRRSIEGVVRRADVF